MADRISLGTTFVLFLWAASASLGAATLGKRILDGSEAPAGAYPWMVSLQVRVGDVPANSQTHTCGGLLIHPRWVLTCGLCTERYGLSELSVATGSHRLSQAYLRSGVRSIHAYPGNLSNLVTHDDIALLELQTPFEGVPPVRLRRPEAGQLAKGTALRVLGWGVVDLDNPEFRTDTLQQADYAMASMEEIPLNPDNLSYLEYLDQRHWMTAVSQVAPGRINRGDSGGPLIWNGPQGWELIGLNSMHIGEWEFFVNVSEFLPWIESITGESLALWKSYHGVVEEDADADTDGRTNREEFFFGTHPRSVDQPGPGGSLTRGQWRQPFLSTLAGQWITYRHSDNLVDWSAATVPGWLFTRSAADGLTLPASPSGTRFFHWQSTSSPQNRRQVYDELAWADSRTVGGSGATDHWFALPPYPAGHEVHLYLAWSGLSTAPAWKLHRLHDLSVVLSADRAPIAQVRTFPVENGQRYVLQVLREAGDAQPFLLVCQPVETGRQTLLARQTRYGNLTATSLSYPREGHHNHAYEFATSAGGDWRIRISSTQFDTVAWLLDPITGERLGFCDDVRYTPEDFPIRLNPGKNLEIRVSSWKPGESGEYSLEVSPAFLSTHYDLWIDREAFLVVDASTAQRYNDKYYQNLPLTSSQTQPVVIRFAAARGDYYVGLYDETNAALLGFAEGGDGSTLAFRAELTAGSEYTVSVIIPVTAAPFLYRVQVAQDEELEEFPEPGMSRSPERDHRFRPALLPWGVPPADQPSTPSRGTIDPR